MEFKHIPVLLEDVLTGLCLKDNGVYVDGTVGGAGHSYEILKRTKNSKLYAFDKDNEALEVAKKRLAEFGDRVTFFHTDFKDAVGTLKEEGVTCVDGVLLDLGVSSYQLDNAERGFSINKDARLDMRMDTSCEFDAHYVVNNYSEAQLVDIFKNYGEEKFARKIALNIIIYRNKKMIDTTTELAGIVAKSVPNYKTMPSDSTRRVFQAIRIEVNGELIGLSKTVQDLTELLAPKGRIAVISFHSLEDRAVKTAFVELAKGCICPPKTPICICGHKQVIDIITRKPIVASDMEIKGNSRSASAKLRIAEKI